MFTALGRGESEFGAHASVIDSTEGFRLREYAYWSLVLSEKPATLGHAIALPHRDVVQNKSESMTDEESAELHELIIPAYESALRTLGWDPIAWEYGWIHEGREYMSGLGWDIVPRYARQIVVGNRAFSDRIGMRTDRECPRLVISPIELRHVQRLIGRHIDAHVL